VFNLYGLKAKCRPRRLPASSPGEAAYIIRNPESGKKLPLAFGRVKDFTINGIWGILALTPESSLPRAQNKRIRVWRKTAVPINSKLL
jgi:hypothetical protein